MNVHPTQDETWPSPKELKNILEALETDRKALHEVLQQLKTREKQIREAEERRENFENFLEKCRTEFTQTINDTTAANEDALQNITKVIENEYHIRIQQLETLFENVQKTSDSLLKKFQTHLTNYQNEANGNVERIKLLTKELSPLENIHSSFENLDRETQDCNKKIQSEIGHIKQSLKASFEELYTAKDMLNQMNEQIGQKISEKTLKQYLKTLINRFKELAAHVEQNRLGIESLIELNRQFRKRQIIISIIIAIATATGLTFVILILFKFL